MPNLMSTAHHLLKAGQARADRIIFGATSLDWAEEIGALRATVRNLCAELDAFNPIDGSVEIQWKGSPLWVQIGDEQIQANGYDIAHFLSKEDRCAIITLAEEAQRDRWLGDAIEAQAELRVAA